MVIKCEKNFMGLLMLKLYLLIGIEAEITERFILGGGFLTTRLKFFLSLIYSVAIQVIHLLKNKHSF